MSSAKKVLSSTENVSKKHNSENNGVQQKSVKYDYGSGLSPYHHHQGFHLYQPPPPPSYYHHRYSQLRTPPRPQPLPHSIYDQHFRVIHDHPTQQVRPQPEPAAAPNKDEVQQKLPKGPRSAFMCFVDNKREELIAKLPAKQKEKQILSVVSRAWRDLSDKERAYWEEQAREDKVRFVREKNDYTGTWSVPKRRAKKHPGAPKRPMSAFLKYSRQVRPKVKKENPDMGNTDISCLLGEMWRNASPEEKAPFVEGELKERAAYKVKIQQFREEQAALDAATRIPHQTAVEGSHLYQQQDLSKSFRTLERPTRGSPRNMKVENSSSIDPLNDESSKPSAFRLQSSQQYHRQSYHNSEFFFPDSYPQATWSALSMDESDPLAVVPPARANHYQSLPQVGGDEVHSNNPYYSTRANGQFSDPFDLPRFPRYP